MRSLLGFANKGINRFMYSNITLNVNNNDHSAVLTLANEKKRNPLSLETIREIKSAIQEVQNKI